MTKDKALKLALEALEFYYDLYKEKVDANVITAIEEALAQPEQRKWVGLTDEEKHDCYLRIDIWSRCVEMVEAKLKEKNCG